MLPPLIWGTGFWDPEDIGRHNLSLKRCEFVFFGESLAYSTFEDGIKLLDLEKRTKRTCRSRGPEASGHENSFNSCSINNESQDGPSLYEELVGAFTKGSILDLIPKIGAVDQKC